MAADVDGRDDRDDGAGDVVEIPVSAANHLLRGADHIVLEVQNGHHFHGDDGHEARENAQALAGAADQLRDALGDDADGLL